MKKILPEIELPKLGAKKFSCYGDKGYVVTFVYSNKGNFVLKGFFGETDLKLKHLIKDGYKFYYRFNIFHEGKVRYSNVKFWKNDIWIIHPEKRTSKYGRNIKKYEFRKYVNDSETVSKTILSLKRLPNRWIPEFENL